MKRFLYLLPVLAFAALALILFRILLQPAAQGPAIALIDKPAPAIEAPPLDARAKGFGSADLRAGHVTVVNIWASWCAPCHVEAPALRALSKDKGFALYGLVQNDTPAKARAFLAEEGNPFSRIGLDASGRIGIEWGAHGLPETYIVDGKGVVRERFVGAITEDMLKTDVLPAIARAQQSS